MNSTADQKAQARQILDETLALYRRKPLQELRRLVVEPERRSGARLVMVEVAASRSAIDPATLIVIACVWYRNPKGEPAVVSEILIVEDPIDGQ